MFGWTSIETTFASRMNDSTNDASSARCVSIRLSATERSNPAGPRFLARWTCAMPPMPRRSKTSYGPNVSGVTGSVAGFTSTSLLEGQLQLPVIEAAVHAELTDVAAVDEAAEVLVGVLGLDVGERVEDVVGAD